MQTSYRFSAPGRTEISGNHTDHQHGCVLAAAVNMQTTAEVTLRDDTCIRVASEGYAPVEIRLDDLSIHEDEKNTTAAIVRAVSRWSASSRVPSRSSAISRIMGIFSLSNYRNRLPTW